MKHFRTIVIAQGISHHEPLKRHGLRLLHKPEHVYFIKQMDVPFSDEKGDIAALHGCHEISHREQILNTIERLVDHERQSTCLVVFADDEEKIAWLNDLIQQCQGLVVVMVQKQGQSISLPADIHLSLPFLRVPSEQQGIPEILAAVYFCRVHASELLQQHRQKQDNALGIKLHHVDGFEYIAEELAGEHWNQLYYVSSKWRDAIPFRCISELEHCKTLLANCKNSGPSIAKSDATNLEINLKLLPGSEWLDSLKQNYLEKFNAIEKHYCDQWDTIREYFSRQLKRQQTVFTMEYNKLIKEHQDAPYPWDRSFLKHTIEQLTTQNNKSSIAPELDKIEKNYTEQHLNSLPWDNCLSEHVEHVPPSETIDRQHQIFDAVSSIMSKGVNRNMLSGLALLFITLFTIPMAQYLWGVNFQIDLTKINRYFLFVIGLFGLFSLVVWSILLKQRQDIKRQLIELQYLLNHHNQYWVNKLNLFANLCRTNQQIRLRAQLIEKLKQIVQSENQRHQYNQSLIQSGQAFVTTSKTPKLLITPPEEFVLQICQSSPDLFDLVNMYPVKNAQLSALKHWNLGFTRSN